MTAGPSRAGYAVLHACAVSPEHCEATGSVGGCLYVADLVQQTPGRPGVARASLSRTLRRLWRAGLIELFDRSGYSLTQRHADADAELQAVERDPEVAFARACVDGGFFPFDTPKEYVTDLRARTARLKRGLVMHIVQITSAGRERLTPMNSPVNRPSSARTRSGA
jgi:hypothetical protein